MRLGRIARRGKGKMMKSGPTSTNILKGFTILLLLTAVSGCRPDSTPEGTAAAGTPSTDAASGKVTIILQENAFHPDRLTVTAGTEVNWINKDPVYHSIRSDSGLFQSKLLAIGQMFSFTFDDPGTYSYYCEKNGGPNGEGMSGVIVVVP